MDQEVLGSIPAPSKLIYDNLTLLNLNGDSGLAHNKNHGGKIMIPSGAALIGLISEVLSQKCLLMLSSRIVLRGSTL